MPRAATAITIPLQGGLGNQLFELAAGIAVGSRIRRRVRFSDYWLTNPAADETPREFALDGLLRPEERVSLATPREGRLTDRLFNHRVVERSADDDALARVGRLTHVLAGYFQRLSYVQEAWPELHARFADSPWAHHRKLVRPDPGEHGAIHYRLGDYVSLDAANAHHGVTAPDYFAEAIRSGWERHGIAHWRIVSDDTESALELLSSVDLPTAVVLSPVERSTQWDDLATLASAKVCVISNSSFSWWAAFLGCMAGSTQIVAPRPWFSDPSVAEPSLFPSDWIRSQRRLL